uniref:Ti plasmid pTi15955 T-DNA region n=1 Tax=Agrobacterium tumefaciens TaxID=358 RepID=Q44399_AGRTU|nr:unnamed protein product [Agrobacterium tumefaciens]
MTRFGGPLSDRREGFRLAFDILCQTFFVGPTASTFCMVKKVVAVILGSCGKLTHYKSIDVFRPQLETQKWSIIVHISNRLMSISYPLLRWETPFLLDQRKRI